jgi:hypothetical protein
VFIWILFTLCVPQTRMQTVNIKKTPTKNHGYSSYPWRRPHGRMTMAGWTLTYGTWGKLRNNRTHVETCFSCSCRVWRYPVRDRRWDTGTCVATARCWCSTFILYRHMYQRVLPPFIHKFGDSIDYEKADCGVCVKWIYLLHNFNQWNNCQFHYR